MLEGLDPVKIDKLSKSMGFPVGGATLMDEVGMDVGMHTGEFMRSVMGDRFSNNETIAVGREIIAKGFFGRKAGKGIYLYSDDSKDKPVNTEALEIIKKHATEPKLPHEDNIVKDRLLLRFVDEAVSCYQDGILRNPVEGDIGLVFGLGFPPNLGGPFRYVDQVGAGKIVARLDEFAAHFGDTVAPCQLLRDMAKDPTRKFHKN
jgi:enoyl-CoA hydratase/long-chain 3-hydroxyacyl-CoA dehydrogenase